jgi:hypothetical protein
MDEADLQSVESPRRARRKRVLMAGVISDLPGTRHFNCTILDITDEGARILLLAKFELPPVFYLINVPARLAYEGVKVWRKGDKTGVRFARTIPLTGKADPAHALLCRLWLQAATG